MSVSTSDNESTDYEISNKESSDDDATQSSGSVSSSITYESSDSSYINSDDEVEFNNDDAMKDEPSFNIYDNRPMSFINKITKTLGTSRTHILKVNHRVPSYVYKQKMKIFAMTES